MYCYLNEQFLKLDEAKIPVTDHGFLYGDGVYETILQENGKLQNLDAHLQRLTQSADQAHLSVPDLDFKSILEVLIQKNNFNKSRVRITLTRGSSNFRFSICTDPTILITEAEIKQAPEEYTATTIELERPVAHIKTTSRVVENLARAKAEETLTDECLLINRKGYITEGSISNLFIVKNDALFYPKLENHLPGTTQHKVLQAAKKLKIKTEEANITLNKLYKADEAFISNALIGIKPLSQVNENQISTGPITQKIAKSI